MRLLEFRIRTLSVAVAEKASTRHTITAHVVIGLCLLTSPVPAQDRPPNKAAPEGGLQKLLVEPEVERPAFPRVDAPDVTLREPKRPEPRYEPNAPAEKLLLKDVDPQKMYYGNYEQRPLADSLAAAADKAVGAVVDRVHQTWDVSRGHDHQAPEETTAAGYEEADRLLRQVMDRHPQTPWADLAQTIRDRGLIVELRASSPKNAAHQGPTDNY